MSTQLRALLVSSAVLVSVCAHAQNPPARPQDIALHGVRLLDPNHADGADDAPKKTLILRGGRIAAIVDADQELPKDVRVIEAHNFFAAPAFVDAYTFAGCTTPQPVVDRDIPPKTASDVMIDMREADRKGIEPAFRVAAAFKLEKDATKGYRSMGFGALASSPHGQLLSGATALATTRDAAGRDAFLTASVFDTLGLDAPGPGYPGTLMGALAQLRQFFLDAQRNAQIVARHAAGKPGERAPFDEDFEAIQPALNRTRRILCEAETANDIERCVKLGDEFGFQIAIAGGREAWRRAPLLKERGIPVFLTLDWGDEPDDPHKMDKKSAKPDKEGEAKKSAAKSAAPKDEPTKPEDPKPAETKGTETKDAEPKPAIDAKGTETPGTAPRDESKSAKKKDKAPDEWVYEEPLRVREEKHRLWEEKRDGAQVLAQAGVAIAFGSGKSAPKELVERVRTLVEQGLPPDVAWKGLTSGAAELLGVGKTLGRVETGFDATLALWSKDPLKSKEAKLGWLVVDGRLFTFDIDDAALVGKPDEGVDATGAWVFTFDAPDAKPANGDLKMEKDGKLSGTIRFKSPTDDSDSAGEFEGQVAGKKFKLEGHVKVGEFEADVTIDGELADDEMKGEARWKFSGGERARKFTASRAPKGGSR